jgi:hypothetical protein
MHWVSITFPMIAGFALLTTRLSDRRLRASHRYRLAANMQCEIDKLAAVLTERPR